MTEHFASIKMSPASDWVTRWAQLLTKGSTVLDVACGHGRHMKWLRDHEFEVVGIDRDPEAAAASSAWGKVHQVDIENGYWPLEEGSGRLRKFGAVVVTNYLWRPLIPTLLNSVEEGGLLIYETFGIGNQVFGKPSRPDFLLQPGELLDICSQENGFQIVAYENGILNNPDRCVQRVVAIKQHEIAKIQQAEVVLQLNP